MIYLKYTVGILIVEIIMNGCSYYIRDERGRLKNAPYVDNSYKWAGGGFLSTVGDLCKFGNAMLYSSQQVDGGQEGGLLRFYQDVLLKIVVTC